MNEKNIKIRQSELISIADSFAWLIKEKLTSIDNMTRAMQAEMSTMGVKKEMVAEYLPLYFKELWEQVMVVVEKREVGYICGNRARKDNHAS